MTELIIDPCPICGEQHINPTSHELIKESITIVSCPNGVGISDFILERYLREIGK